MRPLTNRDVVIPIVFPDYLIAVEQPGGCVDNPLPRYAREWLGGFVQTPGRVCIPARTHRVPDLGHAGVLFFQGSTGLTKYYEYGRYDPAALGLTRRVSIPDVRIADDGRPTAASLRATLARVSSRSGQGGRIEGAYVELPEGAFDLALAYARRREGYNSDPNRTPYALLSNSCMHFSLEALRAAGADPPFMIDPRPVGFVSAIQSSYPALHFTAPATLDIAGVTLQ